MELKLALITNGHNAVGFITAKGLCEKFNGDIYLTVPTMELRETVLGKLSNINMKAEVYLVDTEDSKSVENFAQLLNERKKAIDVLVNIPVDFDNKNIPDYPTYEEARKIIDSNYTSLLIVEKFLFPLLNTNSRVVNVTDACGHISNILNSKWRETLLDISDVTEKNIEDFVKEYLDSVKDGTFDKKDFVHEGRKAALKVARISVAVLTFVQQRKMADRGISINAVHPGSVKVSGDGDELSSAPLYLVFDASPNLKGTFMWQDRKLVDWYDPDGDYFEECSD